MTTDQLTPEQKARGGLGPDFLKGRSWGFGQAVLDSGAYGWAPPPLRFGAAFPWYLRKSRPK